MKGILKNRFNRLLIPFVILVVGGSIGLREFTQLRYQYSKVESVKLRNELKKEGLLSDKPPKTLEEHYEETVKNADIDNWENIRIPRPWDEEEEAKKLLS